MVGYFYQQNEQLSEGARLLLGLARNAVETYVKERRFVEPPKDLMPELRRQAGAFVCLKKNGELRGCIGTIEPTQNNLAEEIIHNAISSASRDPRFVAVSEEELAFISYSVDILGPHEPVVGVAELDPKRYGVIVQSGPRRGLLLPDLEGVESAENQLAIATRKAGIWPDEPAEIFRFEVIRYEE